MVRVARGWVVLVLILFAVGCGGSSGRSDSSQSLDTLGNTDTLVQPDGLEIGDLAGDDVPNGDLLPTDAIGPDAQNPDSNGSDLVSCSSECNFAGESECVSGAVRTCQKTNEGCLVWGASSACPSDKECQNGACVPKPCPGSDCSEVWSQSCTQSGTSYQVCGLDTQGCPKLGPEVHCQPGNSCSNGVCKGTCVKPRVILLVDRSESMLTQNLWADTQRAIVNWMRFYWGFVDLGYKGFPASGQCGVGGLLLQGTDFKTEGEFESLLKAPEANAATPIADALDNIVLGDTKNDAVYVILLTDGEETCKQESDVYANVQKLRQQGIRVFAVGLGEQFNATLLQKVALTGGTEKYYSAKTGNELANVLRQIADTMNICCIDRDGDKRGRYCADGPDCNDSEINVYDSSQPKEVRCGTKTCGVDLCGDYACGLCGPEGDMDGLQPNAPWPMHGYSPTQQRRSPRNAPPLTQHVETWKATTSIAIQNVSNVGVVANSDGTILVMMGTAVNNASLVTIVPPTTSGGQPTFGERKLGLGSRSVPAITPAWTLVNTGFQLFGIAPGKPTATYNLPDFSPDENPVVGGDGTIYLVRATTLYSLRLDADGTFSERWNRPVDPCNVCTAAIAPDGTIVLARGWLTALAPDGSQKWRVLANAYGTPAIGRDGTIYTVDSTGKIKAFDPAGNLKWTFDGSNEGTSVVAMRELLGVTTVNDVEWVIRVSRTLNTIFAVRADGQDFRKKVLTLDTIPNEVVGVIPVPLIDKAGRIYVAQTHRKVFRYSLADDSLGDFAITTADTPIAYAPILDGNGNLIVVFKDGTVVAHKSTVIITPVDN